jgi:hypothetical protein
MIAGALALICAILTRVLPEMTREKMPVTFADIDAVFKGSGANQPQLETQTSTTSITTTI